MTTDFNLGELISPEYRAQNAGLHERNAKYGANGHAWTDRVLALVRNASTYLDYGCGKGMLADAIAKWSEDHSLDLVVFRYDPVTAPRKPEPVDFLTCMDVLEHVEPDLLDNVLRHIKSLIVPPTTYPDTGKALLVISLRKSNKTLPDGRNAHLIVEDANWWMERLANHFSICEVVDPISPKRIGKELAVVVRP